MTVERQHVGPRMSLIATVGNVVHLAGIVADRRSGTSVLDQTAEVLGKIDALLAEAGSSKHHLIKATIWLRDIGSFDEMNSVWDAWVVPGKTPVRACVEARMAAADILVEIQIDAEKS